MDLVIQDASIRGSCVCLNVVEWRLTMVLRTIYSECLSNLNRQIAGTVLDTFYDVGTALLAYEAVWITGG